MKDVYLVYAKRSPIGKFAGAFSQMRIDDLLAELFKDLKNWISFDPLLIDDIIVGCANQAGEDNRNLARMSSLLAQLPFEVPATTINRLCGSSLDALMSAYARIQAGFGDWFIGAGAEMMARAPYVISKSKSAFDRGQTFYYTSIGWRFPNPKMQEMFPLYSMGETAEEVVNLHKISREDQDQFAYESHQKAIKAQKNSGFIKEIVPITVKMKKKSLSVNQDESPREDSTLEKLAGLKPVFRKNGSVTAGNSSSINDGVASLLVVSEDFLKKHNLTPMAKLTGAAVRGLHPNTMGLGPVVATRALCQKFSKKIQDFDLVEINEAFAGQALACQRELDLDPQKINLKGGAIALGHPLGCSGARLVTTGVHILAENPQMKQALITMCIGVGQGIAVSLENCH